MVTQRYDTGEAATPVVAYVRAVRAPGATTWALKVDDCPYCGQAHSHGGGTDTEPDYGRRAAHCARGGYELAPAGGAA